MGASDSFVLGVCGGGGSDALAGVIVLIVAALYGWALLAALARAEDGTELAILIILLIGSIAIGGLFVLHPHGGLGDGHLSRFLISLIVVAVIAVGATAIWREASVGRAVFVAVAGDVLIPGGLLLLFLSSMLFGTGCLS